MKKNLEIIAYVNSKNVEISVVEKNNNTSYCIFTKTSKKMNEIEESKLFIKSTIKEIQKKMDIKVDSINLIIDDFSISKSILKTDTRIVEEIYETTSPIELKYSHFEEIRKSAIEKIEKSKQDKSLKLITVLPFEFSYIDQKIGSEEEGQEVKMTSFPFNARTNKIKSLFSIRLIDKKIFNTIVESFSLVDAKFKKVILASQLSLYKTNLSIRDELVFTFDINDHRSILTSSLNKVTIMNDELKFSYNDLINKLAKKFNLSLEEVANLVHVYGDLNLNTENNNEDNEVIYQFSGENKNIYKKDVVNVIKSFLKSLSLEIREIIKAKTKNFSVAFDVNIVGNLSMLENVDIYCTKHIGSKNVVSNKGTREDFLSWTTSNFDLTSFTSFQNVIESKTLNNLEELELKKKVASKSLFGKKPNLIKAPKRKLNNHALA